MTFKVDADTQHVMTALRIFTMASPGDLTLEEDEIHLWVARLDQPPEILAALCQTLSEKERWRADGFRFDAHRRRFIAARGMLRAVLGGYLKIESGSVRFSYRPGEKPALGGEQGSARFHFNLSHSEELALAAITRGREVGVDVEFVRPIPDAVEIAERFFSAAERAAFSRVRSDEKGEAFWNCWTRKEAYAKAVGDGLSISLDSFDVSLEPGGPARILSLDGDPEKASYWSLFHLVPSKNFVGALAVPGCGLRLSGWKLPEL